MHQTQVAASRGDEIDPRRFEFLKQYLGVGRQRAIAALEEAKALLLARFGR
jgi:hypothetical protein